MVQSVSMLAPVAGGTYLSKAGTQYVAAGNQVIAGVVPGDIESLTNLGCTIIGPPRALNTLVNSSANGAYITQGQDNIIPTSSLATPFLLAAPGTAALGLVTDVINQSTSVCTITASAATIYDEKGIARTVLTGNGLGVISLEAIGSTQFQILNRSLLTSSGGAVYSIASS